MRLADVPIETRRDVGIKRVYAGDDPSLVLAAVVWPSAIIHAENPGTPKKRGRDINGRRRWTSDEDALLGTDTDAHVAELLGATRKSVTNRRVRLGIPKYRRTRKPDRKWAERKVPCATCGEPADPPRASTGRPARCLACFREWMRSRRTS